MQSDIFSEQKRGVKSLFKEWIQYISKIYEYNMG